MRNLRTQKKNGMKHNRGNPARINKLKTSENDLRRRIQEPLLHADIDRTSRHLNIVAVIVKPKNIHTSPYRSHFDLVVRCILVVRP